MQGGQTGTLNRLMGLCQLELAFAGVIPHICSETAAMYLCAPHRRREVKMRLHLSTAENPIVCSMP